MVIDRELVSAVFVLPCQSSYSFSSVGIWNFRNPALTERIKPWSSGCIEREENDAEVSVGEARCLRAGGVEDVGSQQMGTAVVQQHVEDRMETI